MVVPAVQFGLRVTSLRPLSITLSLDPERQSWQTSCEQPDRKYCRLCRPDSLKVAIAVAIDIAACQLVGMVVYS